ncbi:MAG: hypothetical protein QOD39_5100 [Mycobacterium sp.]|nr:hypothetical protein [Mycobacterium sp.]
MSHEQRAKTGSYESQISQPNPRVELMFESLTRLSDTVQPLRAPRVFRRTRRPPAVATVANLACLLASARPTYSGFTDAGWSSSVARWAHNPEVAGSNPAPATTKPQVQTVINDHGSGLVPFSPPKSPPFLGGPIGDGSSVAGIAPGAVRKRAAATGSSSSWCWVLNPEGHPFAWELLARLELRRWQVRVAGDLRLHFSEIFGRDLREMSVFVAPPTPSGLVAEGEYDE